MTREEAISIMNVIIHMLEPQYDNDRVEEAVDMAIEALEQEPCEDAISREGLREPRFIITEKDYQKGWNDALDAVYENAPRVQPKTGHWIIEKDCEGKTRTCMCDMCGEKTHTWKNPNYCSNCGAKMESEEE